MALPALAAAGLKYGPAAIGVLKGLFGGKSAAQKRLERIAKLGYDPDELQRNLTLLNRRVADERTGALSRLRAGNIDPSSGLAQEVLGSISRSQGMRAGAAKAGASEAGQRATELLGAREDDSTGDLLGSLLASLSQDFEQGGLFNKGGSKSAIPSVRTDVGLPTIKQNPLIEGNPLWYGTLKKRRNVSDYGLGLPQIRTTPSVSLPRYLR